MNQSRFAEFERVQCSMFDTTVPLRSASACDDFPSITSEFVEVIGIDSTIDLAKMFGGDDIKIPKMVNGASRMWSVLVETVGQVAAEKLVHCYSRTSIYVPTCKKH